METVWRSCNLKTEIQNNCNSFYRYSVVFLKAMTPLKFIWKSLKNKCREGKNVRRQKRVIKLKMRPRPGAIFDYEQQHCGVSGFSVTNISHIVSPLCTILYSLGSWLHGQFGHSMLLLGYPETHILKKKFLSAPFWIQLHSYETATSFKKILSN